MKFGFPFGRSYWRSERNDEREPYRCEVSRQELVLPRGYPAIGVWRNLRIRRLSDRQRQQHTRVYTHACTVPLHRQLAFCMLHLGVYFAAAAAVTV